MKTWLVKRNPIISGVGKGAGVNGSRWYVQMKRGSSPAGIKAEVGDVVYIYETGYAIWGRGVITSKTEIIKLDSLEDLVSYSTGTQDLQTNYKSMDYWGPEILRRWSKGEAGGWNIFEFCLDQAWLDTPIYISKKYANQVSMQEISGDLESEKYSLDLNAAIPSSLRMKLFIQMNNGASEYSYDIDHFVPKSLGGPGNIEENLIPIGPSINRKKSDDVPTGLFVIAKKMGLDVPSQLFSKSKDNAKFLSDKEAKQQALLITGNINAMGIDAARVFYSEVRAHHFPQFEFKH